jgi:hypothetical protein
MALLVQADGFTLRGLGKPTGWNSNGTEWREKCKWVFAREADAEPWIYFDVDMILCG